jgi:hypothetical protein
MRAMQMTPAFSFQDNNKSNRIAHTSLNAGALRAAGWWAMTALLSA